MGVSLKRFLSSRLATTLVRAGSRAYRLWVHGTVLPRHDRRLIAFLETGEPALFGVWHQDFVQTVGYLSYWNSRRPSYVLASASRDGGLAAAAAEGLGYRGAVRGSSARGGASALLGLHRLAGRRTCSVVVVCDGPRPPARQMKPGLAHLARETGLPIWLVRTSFWPARRLERSWARYHLPKVGSRGIALADGPIRVPPGAALEDVRRDLEERLNRLADRADAAIAEDRPTQSHPGRG